MRFVKVKDEERSGEVAINLDLVREAHFGAGLLHLYFERSATSQDDVTFTGENAQTLTAKEIIVATGSSPRSVPGITIDKTHIITSDQAIHLPQRRSILVRREQ